MENQIEQRTERRSSKRISRNNISAETNTATGVTDSIDNTLPSLPVARSGKARTALSRLSRASPSSTAGLQEPQRCASSTPLTSRRQSLRSANSTGRASGPSLVAAESDYEEKLDEKVNSAIAPGKESHQDFGSFLSTTSTSRRRPRHSTNSDHSSSAAASQRGNSPFSAPATPATAHSVATNVSSSSYSRGRGGKQHARIREGLVASALAGLPSSDPLTDVKHPIIGGKDKKGKKKESPEVAAENVAGSTSCSLKREDPSPPASTTRAAKRTKRQTSLQTDTEGDLKHYPLRSRIAMAPKTQGSASASSSKAKPNARKGRSGCSDAATSTTARAAEVARPGPVEESMDIDTEHGSLEQNHEVNGLESMSAVEDEADDEVDHNFFIGTERDTPHTDDEEMGDHVDDQGEEDEQSVEHDEDYEDEDDEAHYDEDGDEDGDDAWGEAGGGGGPFAGSLRAMTDYMSGLGTRFRALLSSIRNRKEPAIQLIALQELSEVLSISNEDTLAGYFPTETFVVELIHLMGGPKPARTAVSTAHSLLPKEKGSEEAKRDAVEHEELADAVAVEDNGEMMMLACRCLANLIEAMPYAAHSVVSHGAVPVLNSKLVEIEFIDLAEQVLQTLEKISNEYPSAIVREGGLSAMLQYLDFFNIHVQRTAMTAAANCCRRLSPESFEKAKDIMPVIKNVLSYSDQRLVESACRCIVRLIDSYRHHTDLLEQLLTDDVAASINAILLPGSTSSTSNTTISTTAYTDVLKGLGVAARVSPTVAVTLLENNIVETLYVLLTGSAAPSEDEASRVDPVALATSHRFSGLNDQDVGAAIAVIASDGGEKVAMADVAVLQNLAQRPKEQVQEALSLIAELLPPLPRDGIFDPRQYTEKAYSKRKSRIARVGRSSSRRDGGPSASTSSTSPTQRASSMGGPAPTEKSDEAAPYTPAAHRSERVKTEREMTKERAQSRRVKALREKQALVRRFTELVLPTLVEVYAASVGWTVRSKALFGILKIVSFVEPEPLLETLDTVPLASFVASVLSGRDHAMLVQGALQLVELLTTRLPDVYTALLRREGVMWEIEDIASQEPSSSSLKDTKEKKKAEEEASTLVSSAARPSSAMLADVEREAVPRLGPASLPSSNLSRLLASTSVLHSRAGVQHASHRPISGSSPASGLAAVAGGVMSAGDAVESNIWRARTLRDQLSPEASMASAGGANEAARVLDEIKTLVDALDDKSDKVDERAQATLGSIAALFSKQENPISSFELLRSGLVEGLYRFAVGDSDALPQDMRRSMLMQAFMRHETDSSRSPASAVLVRRLQETLSRLENMEITTAVYSSEEARRSPTANVARQVRLKLMADGVQDGDVPHSCTNVVVLIQALTSFQHLHDYLRPKIAATQARAGTSASTSAPAASANLAMLETLVSGRGYELPAALRERILAAGALAGGSMATSAPDASAALSTLDTLISKFEIPTSLRDTLRATQAAATSSSSNIAVSNSHASTSKDGVVAAGKTLKGEEKEVSGTKASEKEGKLTRRRSSRLSGKQPDNEKEETSRNTLKMETEEKPSHTTMDEPSADELLARRLVEGLLQDQMEGLEDDDEAFSDDYDEDFIDDDGLSTLDPTDTLLTGAADETIQLDVGHDGETLASTAPKTDGPSDLALSQSAPADGPPLTAARSAGKISYSSALQKRPVDWHLEFEMDGEAIELESTIYKAVHRHEMRRREASGNASGATTVATMAARQVWANTYTVKYRKVPGPLPEAAEEKRDTPEPSREIHEVDLPPSIAVDAPYARILQLLRVLHSLNREWRESHGWQAAGADAQASVALSEAAFVNNKLTAKLHRQLEEPMIVASSCMPSWSLDLPRTFPFLFPFEARYAFLQSTSFGYHRLINRWQTQQSRNQEVSRSGSAAARHDDSLAINGRLSRQKVRISRSNLLMSAYKVFELYGTNSSLLEVEYFDEVGTGLGPTLEFYAMVSKEFAKKTTRMWRSDESRGDSDSEFVHALLGLFPAPIDHDEVERPSGKERVQSFKILGQFVAKALFDSRIIDLNFSTVFMRAILNECVPATLGTLRRVDESMASSLAKLRTMSPAELDGLELDFTLPGLASYELHPGGKDEIVTSANVEQYIDEVVTHTLITAVKPLVRAFRQGFDTIFPLASMSTFTPEELVMLFGNHEEDWSEPTLLLSIKPDHGYNVDSPTFRDIISVMSTFSNGEQRQFLQWLTGSPKLPIGGFASLHPQLTIVKRQNDASMTADQTLPSVMTCANYFKMPPYSHRSVMRERLLLAMSEGQASFHLS